MSICFRSFLLLSTAFIALSAVAEDDQKVEAFRILSLTADGTLEFQASELPAVTIQYGSALDIESLEVVVNGNDISGLFDPKKHPVERVALPIPLGESSLEIDGCYYTLLDGEYMCNPQSVSIKVFRGQGEEKSISLQGIDIAE